jgi:hypothetical protein
MKCSLAGLDSGLPHPTVTVLCASRDETRVAMARSVALLLTGRTRRSALASATATTIVLLTQRLLRSVSVSFHAAESTGILA